MKLLKSPVLQIPDYRQLLAARGLMAFALQFQSVIVGWQIYQLRHEAIYLGMIGLTEAIPAILGALLAGHFVDVSKPAKVFQASLLVLSLNSLLLFLTTNQGAAWGNAWQVNLLFLAVFISGAARSFTSPAYLSLIPQIVPRAMISQTAAMNSSVFTIAQILGPACGGLAYGFIGVTPTFAVPVAFAVTAWLVSLRLTKETESLSAFRKDGVHESISQSILAGWRFLWGHKVLLSTMSLDMFSVLFGGAVAVLPIFADQVFHVGSTGLGILRAAPAAGAVFISLLLSAKPMRVISGKRLLFVIAGFGACMIGFACTNQFWLAIIFLVISGIFDGVNMIIRGTITQLLTPDHMRGRVSSLSSIFITSSNEIGGFESGVAATAMGLVPSVIFGGVMTLVVVAVVAWKTPQLRQTRIENG